LKFSTGEKIQPKFWNFSDQKVKETKKFPEYSEFNERLRQIKNTVSDTYRRLLNDGIEPSNEILRKELDKKP